MKENPSRKWEKEIGREGTERQTGMLGIGRKTGKGHSKETPTSWGAGALHSYTRTSQSWDRRWDKAFLGGTGRRCRAARVVLGSDSWSVIFRVLNVYAYT